MRVVGKEKIRAAVCDVAAACRVNGTTRFKKSIR